MRKIVFICFIMFFVSANSQKFTQLVAESSVPWTNIAISKEGRIFVSCPRLISTQDVQVSLAEYVDGKFVPYPNEPINEYSSSLLQGNKFNCISSIYVDENDFLWVLDAVNPYYQGIHKFGTPKLHKINIEKYKIVKTYTFDLKQVSGNIESKTVFDNSYLSRFVVDNKRNLVYITDVTLGGIIIMNLNSMKTTRRVLSKDKKVMGEFNSYVFNGETVNRTMNVNGITLDRENDYIYFSVLNGTSICRVKTQYLADASLKDAEMSSKIEVFKNIKTTDGIACNKQGNVFFAGIKDNSLNFLGKNGVAIELEKNAEYQWVSDFAVSNDNSMYFVVSQQNLPLASRGNYKIHKLNFNLYTGNAFEPYWNSRKDQFNTLPKTNNDVVFLGDDFFDNYEFCEVFPNRNVKNRGIAGDRTDGVINRLFPILDTKPSKIILSIGTNDFSDKRTFEDALDNYYQILNFIKTKSQSTQIIICAVPPVNPDIKTYNNHVYNTKKIMDFNEGLKKLSQEQNCIFIDLFILFKNQSNNYIDLNYSDDGFHLNTKGYNLLISEISKYI